MSKIKRIKKDKRKKRARKKKKKKKNRYNIVSSLLSPECSVFGFVIKLYVNFKRASSDGITKTCLYNFAPIRPHFYTVKLGFTEGYIIFLISAQKHRLWVLVRTASPRRFYVPSTTIYVLSRNMLRMFI